MRRPNYRPRLRRDIVGWWRTFAMFFVACALELALLLLFAKAVT